MQNSVMRAGAMAVSHVLLQHGVEPIMQMTCRDRNRLALQSDFLSASILDIHNMLVMRGDDPKTGDHPDTKGVFDLETLQLLEAGRTLRAGKDLAGHSLKGSPTLCLGATANPGAEPLEAEIERLRKKIEAGAEFFQTQPVFDLERFAAFMKAAAPLKPVLLAGVILLKSEKTARFLNEKVYGVSVPERFIDRMAQATDKRQECIRIAVEIVQGLRSLCRGVHVMSLGWDDVMLEVLDRAGVRTAAAAPAASR
jgi:5,10-methylenetetrahydrofolate reductase